MTQKPRQKPKMTRKSKRLVLIAGGLAFSAALYLVACELNLEYPSGLLNLVLPFWP